MNQIITFCMLISGLCFAGTGWVDITPENSEKFSIKVDVKVTETIQVTKLINYRFDITVTRTKGTFNIIELWTGIKLGDSKLGFGALPLMDKDHKTLKLWCYSDPDPKLINNIYFTITDSKGFSSSLIMTFKLKDWIKLDLKGKEKSFKQKHEKAQPKITPELMKDLIKVVDEIRRKDSRLTRE